MLCKVIYFFFSVFSSKSNEDILNVDFTELAHKLCTSVALFISVAGPANFAGR